MRNTTRTAFGAALALAAAALCALPSAPTALAAGESTGVAKVRARLGSLRRDDLVVVDLTGVPDGSGGGGTGGVDTNAVRDIVREELGDLGPEDIGALPDTYVPPVLSVNGMTGDVVVAVSDVAGAVTSNDVESIVGRHYETNTSVRIGAVEGRVSATERWQYADGVTRSAVETGFTEWAIEFSDPSAGSSPLYDVVVAQVMVSGLPTGLWSVFSPTDALHSVETALLPMREAPLDVLELTWGADETPWDGAIVATRVRVPTMQDLEGKADSKDLSAVEQALSNYVDRVDGISASVASDVARLERDKADRTVVRYELGAPYMDDGDVWVVDIDGAVLRFAGEDADSGVRIWAGTNDNNAVWCYEDPELTVPHGVEYRMMERSEGDDHTVYGFSVLDVETRRACGFPVAASGGAVVSYPPGRLPDGGFGDGDLQYAYDQEAIPRWSGVLLAYVPVGGLAPSNVVHIVRGRGYSGESRVVYDCELGALERALRDTLVDRGALTTGFTEWAVESDRPLGEDVVPGLVEGGYAGLWSLFPAGSADRDKSAALTTTFVGGGASVTNLSWDAAATKWGVAVRAARTRVPTMTDLRTIENTASSRWDTVSVYLPWLEDYATNNYTAAKLANRRAKDLEAWQYTNSVSRIDAEAGFTAWAVTPMWPLGRVVVAKAEDRSNLWGLFRPDAPDRRAASALLNVFHHDAGEPTNLVWPSVSVPVEAKWTNELAKAGFDWTGPFDDGNVTSSFRVVASRTRIPCMRDLREIENVASGRWETVSTYIPWLEDYATNNYTAAKLANRRAKDLEAWQYTNSVTRTDVERGVTDWAVTPMWPLGRVVAGQVAEGDDAGKWTLFRPGSDVPLVEPQAVDGYATNIVWRGVHAAVDARWTNELTRAGISWELPEGETNAVCTFDAVATRIRLPTLADIGAAISPSDPVFSNAVLSVGLGVDTNVVAALNGLLESGDGLPAGGAATAGALLVALAAAVAALTRRLRGKLGSDSAAADFGDGEYGVGDHVTHDGVLYRFIAPHAANTAWDSAEVEPVVLTRPDATLDIAASGSLRVMAADGTRLWQQGYSLRTTSSATMWNESGCKYDFAANAAGIVPLLLPPIPAGKVADLILDVTNPDLVDTTSASAYDTGTTYAADQTCIYDGALYKCNTADTTGEWDAGKWDFVAYTSPPAYDPAAASYAVGDRVLHDNRAWVCMQALAEETSGAGVGDWTGTSNWATAQFALDATNNRFVVGEGDDIQELMVMEPGTMARYYFTLTAFAVGGKPTWQVAKEIVEVAS